MAHRAHGDGSARPDAAHRPLDDQGGQRRRLARERGCVARAPRARADGRLVHPGRHLGGNGRGPAPALRLRQPYFHGGAPGDPGDLRNGAGAGAVVRAGAGPVLDRVHLRQRGWHHRGRAPDGAGAVVPRDGPVDLLCLVRPGHARLGEAAGRRGHACLPGPAHRGHRRRCDARLRPPQRRGDCDGKLLRSCRVRHHAAVPAQALGRAAGQVLSPRGIACSDG
mmetsp:Transcript_1577/g.6306  ORF Transcript_1577/g.6306 Transcript_1577/m.6306 type:complete len:223 (-) Transcript_1577:205-873(-)